MQQIRQWHQARPRLVPAFRRRGREGWPAEPVAQLAPARAHSVGLRALSATALALLALATVGAANAAAAPGWLPAVNLSAAGRNAKSPQIAIDYLGDAMAVWDSGGTIRSATRRAGGAWSAPVDLSPSRQHAESPQIAATSFLEAVAVWGAGGRIWSATRNPAWIGGWSLPLVGVAGGHEPQVAISSSATSEAVAVWRHGDGIWSASGIPGNTERGHFWDAPVRVSAAGPFPPQVGIDREGDEVAVWILQDGSNRIVQSATRPRGGAWSAPVDLSPSGGSAVSDPQVAFDYHGDAVAVWAFEDGGKYLVQSASRPRGGAWSAPVDLSAPQRKMDAMDPHVAIDPRGDGAVAVWTFQDGINQTLQSAMRPRDGAWSAPVDLSTLPGRAISEPRVAFDHQGDAVAAWERGWSIESATRPRGGAWSAPVTLSTPAHKAYDQDASHLELAAGPHGDAVAVWQRSGDRGTIVQAASREAAAPRRRPQAYAAPVAHRKGTNVLLELLCRGHGSCRGAVKLFFEHRPIAKGRFTLAAHRARALRIKLNRRGRELVRNTHRHRLKLELGGRCVEHRTEVLKGP